jgi:hypothetical protein
LCLCCSTGTDYVPPPVTAPAIALTPSGEHTSRDGSVDTNNTHAPESDGDGDSESSVMSRTRAMSSNSLAPDEANNDREHTHATHQ